MFTRKFWADAVERAVKSAAQGVLVLAGADGANLIHVDIKAAAAAAAGMAVVSLLMSLVSSGVGRGDSASLVNNQGVK